MDPQELAQMSQASGTGVTAQAPGGGSSFTDILKRLFEAGGMGAINTMTGMGGLGGAGGSAQSMLSQSLLGPMIQSMLGGQNKNFQSSLTSQAPYQSKGA
jgi:hypothetical protein